MEQARDSSGTRSRRAEGKACSFHRRGHGRLPPALSPWRASTSRRRLLRPVTSSRWWSKRPYVEREEQSSCVELKKLTLWSSWSRHPGRGLVARVLPIHLHYSPGRQISSVLFSAEPSTTAWTYIFRVNCGVRRTAPASNCLRRLAPWAPVLPQSLILWAVE